MKRHVFRFALFVGLICSHALAAGEALEAPWPKKTCEPTAYWLRFLELEFCLERSEVARLEVLRLSEPSMELQLERPDRGDLRVAVSYLPDRKVTGGLHERFGLTVRQFLDALVTADADAVDLQAARAVMSVDSATRLFRFVDGEAQAFAVLRPRGGYSDLFLLHARRPGAIQLSGDIDRHVLERILGRVAWTL